MPVIVLTDITLRNLKPVPGKQVTYIDRSLKGFGVRISENGARSYVLTYGANRQRIKLGDVGILKLADARQKAKNILAERQLGVHVSIRSPTYQDALQSFLDAKQTSCKPRTHYDYTRLLNRHGFGQERLSGISPHDIHRKLDNLPPSERAHAQAALAIFFRFCLRRHYVEKNPLDRLERLPKRTSRSRILSDDEIKAVWNASSGMFGDIVKLCLLTGQRRSEIAHLTTEMIDSHSSLMTFPAEFTKNRREHAFPFDHMTSDVLRAALSRRSDQQSPYLFPARKTWRKKATVYNAWNKDKPLLDTASGVTDWVLHDLRRTLSSNWAALSIPLEVTEKYLNHISGSTSGVAGIYNRHTYLPEMRDAVKKWEMRIQSILARDP
jgi:integrase